MSRNACVSWQRLSCSLSDAATPTTLTSLHSLSPLSSCCHAALPPLPRLPRRTTPTFQSLPLPLSHCPPSSACPSLFCLAHLSLAHSLPAGLLSSRLLLSSIVFSPPPITTTATSSLSSFQCHHPPSPLLSLTLPIDIELQRLCFTPPLLYHLLTHLRLLFSPPYISPQPASLTPRRSVTSTLHFPTPMHFFLPSHPLPPRILNVPIPFLLPTLSPSSQRAFSRKLSAPLHPLQGGRQG